MSDSPQISSDSNPSPGPAPAISPAVSQTHDPDSILEPMPDDPPQAARRRNGKIAHLPQEQRDLINRLFDDGVKYESVIEKLALQGVSLNLKNLSDWFHGGYEDELRLREQRARIRESQQRLLQTADSSNAPALSLVGLQLAITQIAEHLLQLAPGSHKDAFQNDTPQYTRIINTLGRISKTVLSLQKYQDEIAAAKAAQLVNKDIERELSDREHELIMKRMDRLFRVGRPSTPPPAPNPNAAQPAAPPPNGPNPTSPASLSLPEGRAPASP